MVPGGGEDVPQAGLVHGRELDLPGPLGQVQPPQREREQGRLVLQHPAGLQELPADGGRLGGPVAPVLALCDGAARPEPPEEPPERLAGQHLRPSGPGRRDPAAQQDQRPLEMVPGRGHLAQLQVRLGQQPVPAGPGRRRDLRPTKRGAKDGLGLAEPAPAPVQRPQPAEVAVEVPRFAVLDQSVGRRPQVLDLEVALAQRGRLGRAGEQRRIVLSMTLAGGLLVGRVGSQPLGSVLT